MNDTGADLHNSLFDISGKVAVVTGGSGALGGAMVAGLARAGARVAVLARRESAIDAVISPIRAAGGQATGFSCDVLDRSQVEAARDHVLSTFGQIDILVNGAGGNRPEATAVAGQRAFFDLPQEALDNVFALNLTGTILPSQMFAQVMAGQGHGAMVNISSMAAFRPLTRVVAYGAAKAAINSFTQWLAVHMAQEYSPRIRVNAIAPGFFLGDQNRYLLTDEHTGELTPRGKQIIGHTPMARFGDPDDLIGTLLWLVSDAAHFVTGIVVPVDGGFSAYSGV